MAFDFHTRTKRGEFGNWDAQETLIDARAVLAIILGEGVVVAAVKCGEPELGQCVWAEKERMLYHP